MKLSNTLLLAAVSTVTLAQNLGDLPSCAQQCVGVSNTINVPGCPNTLDIHCICSNQNYLQQLSCCLLKNCQPADQQKAIGFAGSLCKTAGVNVPSKLDCPTANGGGNSSPSGQSSAPSSSMPPSMGTSSTGSSTGGAGGMTPTSTSSGSSPTAAGSAASSVDTTDAANRLVNGVQSMGVAGALAALLALF